VINLSPVDDILNAAEMTATLEPLHQVPALASLGVSPDEIVGLTEIAEMFGVTKRTAVRYRNRSDFPDPLARLSAGLVWRRVDVETWAKQTLPLRRGRPPKG
jgi:predicted DNA-binding transcriptional regulator AlpA